MRTCQVWSIQQRFNVRAHSKSSGRCLEGRKFYANWFAAACRSTRISECRSGLVHRRWIVTSADTGSRSQRPTACHQYSRSASDVVCRLTGSQFELRHMELLLTGARLSSFASARMHHSCCAQYITNCGTTTQDVAHIKHCLSRAPMKQICESIAVVRTELVPAKFSPSTGMCQACNVPKTAWFHNINHSCGDFVEHDLQSSMRSGSHQQTCQHTASETQRPEGRLPLPIIQSLIAAQGYQFAERPPMLFCIGMWQAWGRQARKMRRAL